MNNLDYPGSEAPSITILSTSFPPKGGSGVQRPYYQAKYLNELGWKVQVLSVDGDNFAEDVSFAALSSRIVLKRFDAQLIRTNIKKFGVLEKKLRRKFFFPDEFKFWVRRVVSDLSCGTAKRQILMASVGSPSTLNILDHARRSVNGKSFINVVDFRDFWALNQRQDVPEDRRDSKSQSKREEYERRVLRNVDGVVVVSHAYKERLMAAYPWFRDEQVLVVENGFVEDDFAKAENLPRVRGSNEKFIIRYTGFLLDDHNPDVFFAALRILKVKHPDVFSSIAFEYYGGNPSYVRNLASKHDVAEICRFESYTPHREIIELILSADALYLPFARGAGTIGGKTYEYLRSGRPLIPTLSDCDEARQLLEKFGVTRVVNENDPEGVVGITCEMVRNTEDRSFNRPSMDNIQSIERSNQTKTLSDWLLSLHC